MEAWTNPEEEQEREGNLEGATAPAATDAAVSRPTPMPQWMKNMARNWRQMLYMSAMFQLVRDLEGNVVECGVGNGDTLGMLAMLVGEEQRAAKAEALAGGPFVVKKREIFGFDSWAGWPAPTVADTSSFRKPKEGDWKRDRDAALARLKEIGIEKEYPDVEIKLVDGFFADSLPKWKAGEERQIALLHADCDLETSYTDCLENLWDLVVPGGVVMFDEVLERSSDLPAGDPVGEKWPGATKAVIHFLAKRGLVGDLRYWPATKKYYIVKRGRK